MVFTKIVKFKNFIFVVVPKVSLKIFFVVESTNFIIIISGLPHSPNTVKKRNPVNLTL